MSNIMLPTRTNTLFSCQQQFPSSRQITTDLLRIDCAFQLRKIRVRAHGAQKNGLELIHPCVREQEGGIE